MRLLGSLVVVAALAFAGCANTVGCSDCAPCAFMFWSQPALFDAMGGLDGQEGVELVSVEGPSLPFAPSEWDLPVGTYSLFRLEWTPEDTRAAATFGLVATDEPGVITLGMRASPDIGAETARDGFDVFIEAVANASVEQRDAWFTAMMAAPVAADGQRAVNVTDLRTTVTELADDLAARGLLSHPDPYDLEDVFGFEGVAVLGGGWAFDVRFFQHQATITTDAGLLTMHVNALDRVQAFRQGNNAMDVDDTKAWTEQAFAAHGLPAPGFEGFRATLSHC